MNDKYEITDIHHEQYPFLRRIRALRDIGEEVKAGALGGFVEHEGNLSFEPGDDAWIFQNAIACADAYVDKEFGTGCVKITPAHDPSSGTSLLPAIRRMFPMGPSSQIAAARRMTPTSGVGC